MKEPREILWQLWFPRSLLLSFTAMFAIAELLAGDILTIKIGLGQRTGSPESVGSNLKRTVSLFPSNILFLLPNVGELKGNKAKQGLEGR